MMNSAPVSTKQSRAYGVAAVSLLVFASILGVLSAGPGVHRWDISFAQWIQHWEGSFGETLYNIGDMLGTTSLAATVTVIALIIAIASKRVHISIFLMLALLLRLAGTQLKPLFDSPRPTEEHLRLLEPFDGTGYPSGHSTTVAMVACMLTLIAWRYSKVDWLQWIATFVAAAAIVLVGWSRVWSGAHWPSDVLGGWSYGIALTLVAWILADVITARFVARQDMAEQTATG